MCCLFFMFFAFWFRDTITCYKYVKDKLIDLASVRTIPYACDLETR